MQELSRFVWWKARLTHSPEGDPSGKSIRTGHGLCRLLLHDLSFQFHREISYRTLEPEIKHRIANKEPFCIDFETCFIYFFSKFTPLASTTSCDSDFNNLYENKSFNCFLMPHNFIASLLVLRLWEIVSSDSPFPFSMPPLVLQTWFYFPIHSSHSFLKLKNSSILSLSLHRRTMQPNTFISIIHSGIFANGKKKNLRWVRGRYELGKMREIFLTLVPMTTLPVALLRPVTECEDAVSFQLHFSLLSHFLCIFFFLGFPKSIQPGYKISVLKFRMSWDMGLNPLLAQLL